MTDTHVGFIGLGNIGKPMARHLASSDFDLTVFDVYTPSTESFAKHGTKVAKSPAEMAETCSIIGVCVRDDADVESVLFGDDGAGGIMSTAKPGTIIAIHSTVQQNTIINFAKTCAEKEIHLVDAAISGGAQGASEKTLAYMYGGSKEILDRCRPVFETSGDTIIHAGELGAGIALKLCNNLMTYAAFIAIHESAKLAAASGLSFDVLKEVGKSNGVITPQMTRFIENRNALYEGCSTEDLNAMLGPFAALGVKDLGAALQSAKQLDITLPATEKNAELIEGAFLNAY